MHIPQDSGLTHCWFELCLEARSDVDMPKMYLTINARGLGDRLEVSDMKESKGMMIPTSASYCKNTISLDTSISAWIFTYQWIDKEA